MRYIFGSRISHLFLKITVIFVFPKSSGVFLVFHISSNISSKISITTGDFDDVFRIYAGTSDEDLPFFSFLTASLISSSSGGPCFIWSIEIS